MASTLEMQPSMKQEDLDFNLTEWGMKGGIISRENTKSRRHSATIIRSFREDTKSFRSNITISSTASSPGYTLKGTLIFFSFHFQEIHIFVSQYQVSLKNFVMFFADEIDPSTYSFTTALKGTKE
jgi:hypothetical protein